MWFAVTVHGLKLTLLCAKDIIQVLNKVRALAEIYLNDICLCYRLMQTFWIIMPESRLPAMSFPTNSLFENSQDRHETRAFSYISF